MPLDPHKKPRSSGAGLLEQSALVLVALAAIGVGVLDFSGLLSGTLFANRVSTMTLVILGLVAAYLVLERRGTVKRLGDAVDSLGDRIASLETSAAHTAAFLAGFTGDRFSELKLIYGLRGFTSRVTNTEIRADRDQVFNMWSDLLRDASTFSAFNYVSPDEVWGTEGSAYNVAHAQQIARIKQGCAIKRVFVIDFAVEYEKMLPLMEAQTAAGMEIRWLLRAELKNRPIILDYLRELETWDFVCVDADTVFRVNLDGNRRMAGCSASRDREVVRKASHVFMDGFNSAHKAETTPSALGLTT